MSKKLFVVVMFYATLGLLLGGVCLDARAESVIAEHSVNGVSLDATETNFFNGVGSVAAVDSNHNSAHANLILPTGVTATASAGTTLLPAGGGAAKDKASGMVDITYKFGSPYTGLPHDELSFLVNCTVSAEAAKNAALNPASAVVQGYARAHFYVDTPPAAVTIGYLNLPSLRNLYAGETLLNLKVIEDATPILNMAAGEGGQVVELVTGRTYDVQLDYAAEAPFGTDPNFTLQYVASVTSKPVPEPGTLALLSMAGTALGFLAWRRRGANAGSRGR